MIARHGSAARTRLAGRPVRQLGPAPGGTGASAPHSASQTRSGRRTRADRWSGERDRRARRRRSRWRRGAQRAVGRSCCRDRRRWLGALPDAQRAPVRDQDLPHSRSLRRRYAGELYAIDNCPDESAGPPRCRWGAIRTLSPEHSRGLGVRARRRSSSDPRGQRPDPGAGRARRARGGRGNVGALRRSAPLRLRSGGSVSHRARPAACCAGPAVRGAR